MLIFIPYLSFVVIWFIAYYAMRNKKKATGLSIDITAFLLVGAVANQMHKLFGSWLGFWLMLFVILLIIGLIGRKQNELRGQINPARITKIIMRMGFVVLSFLYIVLLILNLL